MAAVRGDKQLTAAMRAISNNTVRSLDRVGLESLEPLEEQTRRNAMVVRQPGRSPRGGHLDQGVVTRKVKGQGSGLRVFWVALTKRARKIGHLVEFGTSPHWQPLRKRMHPGARAKPFMTPAFVATRNVVVGLVGKKIWNSVVATAAVLGRRK